MYTLCSITRNLVKNIKFHIFSESAMTRVPVTVREGRLLGIVEDGYCGRYVAFKGIPYATPPVGDLRFKVNESVLIFRHLYCYGLLDLLTYQVIFL